jgi:NADH-quinone oxidoreductase subunit L
VLESIWVIPTITFTSFWFILFFGKRLPKHGAEIGIAALTLTFVLSCVAVFQWNDRPADEVVEAGHEAAQVEEEGHALGQVQASALDLAVEAEGGEGEHEVEPIRSAVERNVTWFSLGDVQVQVGTAVDGLAVMLLFTVTLISLLVHVFSTNYMHGDVRFTYFFAALSLFTTGMLLLVVSSSLLQALFGWELMGLCSFMLIGHWWEKKPNSDAAMKAFLTTRTGDIGLLVGIVIMFFAAGQTFDIATINELALRGGMGETALLVGALALFAGVIGKSAQFPLHTWPGSTACSGRPSTSAGAGSTPSPPSGASPSSSPPPWPSSRPTSRRCWPTPR